MKSLGWFSNLSLKKKLLVILALVGLVPLTITLIYSYREIRNSSLNSQDYAANQSHEQTLQLLSAQFSNLEKLSSMIIVSEALDSAMAVDPEHTDIGQQIINFERVSNYTRVLENSSDSRYIIYYVDDRFVISGTDTRFRKLSLIQEKDWAVKVRANNGAPTWIVYNDEGPLAGKEYLALSRVMWNSRDFMDSIGLVVIHLELKGVEGLLNNSVPEQLVYLSGDKGAIAANRSIAESNSLGVPIGVDTKARFRPMTLDSGTYLVRSNQVGNTGLFLISAIPKSAAYAAADKVGKQMISIYLVVSLLLLIFIFPITRSITSRIFMLTRKIDRVRSGELSTLDIEPGSDEVGQLVSSYNYMIESVQKLMKEQFRLGEEKKGAELKALQSQINPHFLYNTLDMLNWMAQREERENIQRIIYALSDYYKLTLNKGEDYVKVRDELRMCSVYVEIQQNRFKGKIGFEIDVEEEILDCLLPKITLQPLVENAIIHGISENPEGKGTILITGDVRAGRLSLVVADDGPGMSDAGKQQREYRGSGYGVKNIEKRLELFFAEAHCLSFESELGVGTRAIIRTPALKERPEGK